MQEKFDYTIVYVFGPKRCEKTYLKDEPIEWVKIGQTGFRGSIEGITRDDLKDEAMKLRVKNEPKTGIPETSKIFDAFIFPYKPSKTDDSLRKRLCNDLFDIENSKNINQQLRKEDEKYIIPAGDEFAYNVRRSHIKYAVQSFDHDLIIEAKGDDEITQAIQICRCNNIDITQETEEDGKEVLANRKPNLNLDDVLVENAEVELRDSHGEIVKDENGNPVKAVYRGRNKFECKGVISHSSPLALKFLTDYAGMKRTSINGNEHWYYEGRKLTSYRM